MRKFLQKIRPLLWLIGAICAIFTIWFALKGNYAMATNFGIISTIVVGVPEILSEDIKPSNKPFPSAEAISRHQKKIPQRPSRNPSMS
ncbi:MULTISPECIES: hypothetical protein [unclassified Corynebacterium]|uniref:hypothetical protein n=1 Tax=unclassified Corynebacterium TaxID=2624378 RepID=UPI0029C9EC0F|nr:MULTISPECIES: hypothetical protein [unclassified Corynebacterium]WPF65808.1 hypothetical protein OLX12_09660 [Corynebacterium sp. 22KM0430]WPF68301.1 hypothetical protein OLW90_09655 [Corynebacterium sp. 21KM1197]